MVKTKIKNIWNNIVDWFRKDAILMKAEETARENTVFVNYKDMVYYVDLSSNTVERCFYGFDYSPSPSWSMVRPTIYLQDQSSMHPSMWGEDFDGDICE